MIISLFRIIFAMTICIQCASSQQQTKDRLYFPKIVWAFWDQGFQTASTFTKLCLNNQRYYAESSGWEYRLLERRSIHQYLDYDKIIRLWELNFLKNKQSLSDIIRICLLKQYGGMWMDANSFFVEKLSWVDTIKGLPHIYNQHGDSPEIILGSFSKDPYIQFNNKPESIIFPLPNLENWFMLSILNGSFIQEAYSVMEKILMIGRQAANTYYGALGVVNPFNQSDYFLLSDYTFQTVVQLKQIEFFIKKSNQHAIHYYKIWNMEGYKTAFMLEHLYGYLNDIYMADIFYYPMKYYEQKYSKPRYFVKLTSQNYPQANRILNNYLIYYCDGFNFKIEKDSIIDQYLLSHYHSQISQLIRLNNSELSQVCLKKQTTVTEKHSHVVTIGLIFSIMILIYWLTVWKKCQKTGKYEKYEQI